MFDIQSQKTYNCVLVFEQVLSKSEIHSSVYHYSKLLKKLGAGNIAAVLKNDFVLTYPIKKKLNLKFVEFSFLSHPQALSVFTRQLQLDESVLRFFITKEN